MGPSIPARPVIFGEVLFDVFPDGTAVLGGAAFNVAWNLRGLGLDPLFVSRVGDDERGRGVLGAMERFGMDTSAVEVDPIRPTGVVTVAFRDGEPSYEIIADQAYDRIEARAAKEAIDRSGGAALLYHGTLALRAPESRSGLERLRDAVSCPVFVDVNLREPWWSRDDVLTLVHEAEHAKLNVHELALLTGLDTTSGGEKSIVAAARRLRAERELEELIVTRGADGALLVTRDGEEVTVDPPAGAEVVDTVGAGDAFSAAMILGLLRGWPSSLRLARAAELASRICGIRGATTEDRELYRALDWSD